MIIRNKERGRREKREGAEKTLAMVEGREEGEQREKRREEE